MEISTLISVAGKRQGLSQIDAEFLRLKRDVLTEKLSELQSDLESAVRSEKAEIEKDLIRRRLDNSSMRFSSFRAVENDAAVRLEKALREFNRAIEEIALMERKIQEQSETWWTKLRRWCRRRRQ
jgi:hypothetical protein